MAEPIQIREKSQLMSASEIDRTLVRLAHEMLEKTVDISNLAFIGIRRPRCSACAATGEQNCLAREPASSSWHSGHQSLP